MVYEYYRTKDICKIKSGKRLPKGTAFSDEKTEYAYIRARDIKNGKINTDSLVYISSDVKKKIKKYIIEKGDIAITIVGENIGDVGYCEEECSGFNLTENAVRLTDFSELVNSRYLCYFLNQTYMKRYMSILGSGAAQGKLGIYKIEKMKLPLPEKSVQDRVAYILSQYDLLIDTIDKKIDVLSKLAHEIYKEWFVRFRFCEEKIEFKDSKLGKIPKCFNIINMEDAFDYYIGGGWGSDEENKDFPVDAYVIRGTDFPNVTRGDLTSLPFRYHKQSNFTSRKLQKDDIVIEVSGGTAEQPVGRTIIVSDDMIRRLGGKVICASFCKLIRLNKEVVSPYYFYYWMQFLYDTRIIDKYQLQSTGIINFKFEYFLQKGDLLLPPKELMEKFEKAIIPVHDQIDVLARKRENLVIQRDLLQGRLMSGKLKVH